MVLVVTTQSNYFLYHLLLQEVLTDPNNPGITGCLWEYYLIRHLFSIFSRKNVQGSPIYVSIKQYYPRIVYMSSKKAKKKVSIKQYSTRIVHMYTEPIKKCQHHLILPPSTF